MFIQVHFIYVVQNNKFASKGLTICTAYSILHTVNLNFHQKKPLTRKTNRKKWMEGQIQCTFSTSDWYDWLCFITFFYFLIFRNYCTTGQCYPVIYMALNGFDLHWIPYKWAFQSWHIFSKKNSGGLVVKMHITTKSLIRFHSCPFPSLPLHFLSVHPLSLSK